MTYSSSIRMFWCNINTITYLLFVTLNTDKQNLFIPVYVIHTVFVMELMVFEVIDVLWLEFCINIESRSKYFMSVGAPGACATPATPLLHPW